MQTGRLLTHVSLCVFQMGYSCNIKQNKTKQKIVLRKNHLWVCSGGIVGSIAASQVTICSSNQKKSFFKGKNQPALSAIRPKFHLASQILFNFAHKWTEVQ